MALLCASTAQKTHTAGPCLQECGNNCAKRISTLQPLPLANTVWAFGFLGKKHHRLFDACAKSLVGEFKAGSLESTVELQPMSTTNSRQMQHREMQ